MAYYYFICEAASGPGSGTRWGKERGAFQRFPTYPAAIAKIRLCSSFSEMFSPSENPKPTDQSIRIRIYSRFQLLAFING